VRWANVPGVTGYSAEATLSDGRRLSFTRGFRIPAVGRGVSVRIAVRSLRADGAVSRPARLTVHATRRSAAVKPRNRKGGRR
jgi:hypothetical protein